MDTVYGAADMTNVEFPTRVSARGILSGVLVGLAFALMLMVLGAAIGLTAFEPRGDVAKGLGIGFAGWVLLSLIISAFVGGWIATSAARAVRRRDGVLHGMVTWAAVTLVGVSLLGGAVRSAVGGIFGIAKTATQAAASSPAVNRAASDAAQQPGMQQKLGNALDSATANPQQLAAKADQAASGAAMGTWGMLAALLLPLFAAIGGGVVGAGRERRVIGLPAERELRRRKPVVVSPSRHEVPTHPLPST
ncbi:MAG: hypothetical protein JWN44_4304 [Myxococcales bacterium]|nr:hypothetical protein [Myxococcales bacterium]